MALDTSIIDDSTTEVDKAPTAVKEDDKHHAVHGDAELHDPPLRTPRPDVPIAQRLADGAGKHTPGDLEDFNDEGRFVGQTDAAFVKPGEDGSATKAEQNQAAKEQS
jgi:hypothetical protein